MDTPLLRTKDTFVFFQFYCNSKAMALGKQREWPKVIELIVPINI